MGIRTGRYFSARAILVRLLCVTILATGGVIAVQPNASALGSPVGLELTLVSSSGFTAGGTVSLNLTGTNTTAAPLTFADGAGLWFEVGHSWTEDLPGAMSGGCYAQGWGDLGAYSIDDYFDPLPATLSPGQSISCTYTYTATPADVVNGGVFATLKYMASDGSIQDTDWRYYLVPAHGVAELPAITGTPAVGQTLGISSSYWGMWDDGSSYQWLRGGTPIPGATQSTYTVAVDDLGSALTVQVHGLSAEDGSFILKSSPSTAAVAAGTLVTALPSVSGVWQVGTTVTAWAGAWGPAGVQLGYQWLRGGSPIGGATASTYVPTSGDVGQTVSVRVTGSLTGYTTASMTSAGVTVTANPTVSFVRAAYQDFLGRQPTAGELSAALTNLALGTWSKEAFLRTLANSTEWLSVIVTKMYQDTLGRNPDSAGLATWVDWIRTGRFTVAQAAALFYSSNEFYAGLGGGTPTTWVTKLYQKLLLREPDTAGLAGWVSFTTNPAYGRSWVAGQFYQSYESRLTRVKNLYQVLLGRDPDPTGWPFWAGVIQTSGDIQLAVSLASSVEYQLRSQGRF